MFRIRFLRNIFFLTLAIAIGLPLCASWLVQPAYQEAVTEETEQQAVHFVDYLRRSLGLEKRSLTGSTLPAETLEQVGLLRGDPSLVKLRIFSAAGEIIYSTEPGEVGRVNDKPYFRHHVQAGRVYSKVVRRDGRTAEQRQVQGDVVETYVPIMIEGGFGGAVETYYDISSLERIEGIARRSSMLMWGISLSLLGAMVVVLRNSSASVDRQLQAEQSLREAKKCLEERVAERTAQLEAVNRWLKAEMHEHRLVREKVDSILRAVADGLLVLDADGRISLMNPAGEKLLGLKSDQAIGRSLEALRNGSPMARQLCAAMERAADSGEMEIQAADPDDGTDRHVRLRLSSAFAGRKCSDEQRVLLLQDVTRERRAETMKREFLAMVAHELHTPLTGMIGYTELLAESAESSLDNKRKSEFAAHVHSMALNLARIVNDLLDIGRIEAGHCLVLDKTEFPLDDLARQLVRQYESTSRAHRFVLALPEEPVLLHGDPSRLQQVLENLITNAVKYSPDGGEIRVALERCAEQCRVSVCDQGIGMSRDQEEKVFEKFYRADHARVAASGSGLGLSVARQIVDGHGGEIWATSQLGRGTTVSFTLPLERRQGANIASRNA